LFQDNRRRWCVILKQVQDDELWGKSLPLYPVEKGVIHMPLLKTLLGAVIGEEVGRRKGHGLLGAGIGILATRIATRSIPGALAVGGALVAKRLYDRRKARRIEQ
jgi:hypothetical protein